MTITTTDVIVSEVLQSIDAPPRFEGGWRHKLAVGLLAGAAIATILWAAFLCALLASLIRLFL
jgi:hypothetical protein